MLRDANGNVRVKIGNLDEESDMNYMYHFTRDGEYVDGVPVTNKESADSSNDRKLAATYEGCQVWGKAGVTDDSWMSIAANGIAYDRWEPVYAQNVPECVRTAELMRGV